jgi:pimeloyl-ACP methyl ester carboxylesterase
MHPSIFDPIEDLLLSEFRVVRFDERGTGQSDRVGPYDMATGVSDLELICETAGPFEAALCLVDSANRAVRVANAQPDLVRLVFCVGSAPFGVGALSHSESLLSSEAVVSTYLQQLEADYRGAVRAALAGANTGLNDDQVRERVQIQMDYIDAEAAAVRAREWASDSDAEEPGQALGNRLSVCLSKTMGGPGAWFPSGAEMEPVVRDMFSDAQVHWTDDGIVSTPGQVVGVLKDSLAALAESATYDPRR